MNTMILLVSRLRQIFLEYQSIASGYTEDGSTIRIIGYDHAGYYPVSGSLLYFVTGRFFIRYRHAPAGETTRDSRQITLVRECKELGLYRVTAIGTPVTF